VNQIKDIKLMIRRADRTFTFCRRAKWEYPVAYNTFLSELHAFNIEHLRNLKTIRLEYLKEAKNQHANA